MLHDRPWADPDRQLPMARERTRAPARHRIALVLGSGGVRSAAAIGVAQVLEQAGLRPDLVVGCSSGALFGAAIAARMPPPQALKLAVSLWSPELTQQRRWWSYAQLLMPRLARFGPDFALRDSRLIGHRFATAFGESLIEELPTPLRVVATDAQTGAGVVLTQGKLVDALRASTALPFLFSAVQVEGRRLIDGVLADPLPVAAAIDADVVITLGFEGRMPRHINRPSRMVGQVSTALLNNLMQARLQAAAASGQCLLPLELQLGRNIGLWETTAIPELHQAGVQAALRALPQLQAATRRPPAQAALA